MADVILVDENDNEIGMMEKLEAHRRELLHRAISVFVFHPDGKVLLQKRAQGKYHSAGLWSNTCCSHPNPGEGAHDAARRRLKEEMGIECDLKEVGTFIYKTTFANGLIENELDHVFIGISETTPKFNPEEVDDWRWQNVATLRKNIEKNPAMYASWLPTALGILHA